MTIDWSSVTSIVSQGVNVLAPLVEAADPALGVSVGIISKVVAGVAAAEPSAVALYNRLTSGQPVTPEELKQFASDYEAAYQQLNADINVKLGEAS